MEGRKEGGEEEREGQGRGREEEGWMGSAEKWRRGGRGRGDEMQREEGC